MKAIIKHLSILGVALLITMPLSADKVVLSTDNISDMSAEHYYIVDSDINLNDSTIYLPSDAVIKFEGGSFTGTGTININGAVIVADSYPIFGKNVTVQGQFGNDEVLAGWFGAMDKETAAGTINRALRSASKNIVEIGGNVCLINDTIFIDQDGQRLTCTGTLKVSYTGTTPDTGLAIDISANNVGLEVKSIETYYAKLIKDYKPGTAIRIHGDVRNSRFDIIQMSCFQRGIVIEPGYTNKSGVISDNVFNFQYNIAQRPFEVNLTQKGSTAGSSQGDTNRFSRNRINGGRLLGFYGVKYNSDDNATIKGVSEYNVYNCVGFETIDTMCIDLKNCRFDRFVDLRMNEDLPDSLRSFIKLADTQNAYIMIKGGFISDYLVIGEGCADNVFDIPMTSANSLFYAPTRTIATSAVKYPGEDPVPGTEYEPLTTFNLGSYNVYKTVEYPDAATKTEETITLHDLMPQTHKYDGQNQTVLGGLCHIKIGKNRVVKLNAPRLEGSDLLPRANFDLAIDCADSGSFRLNDSITVTQSGTYRLTLKRIIEDTEDVKEVDRWYAELIKIL